MNTVVTLEILCRAHGLEQHTVRQWIARDWVRPDSAPGDDYVFQDIDQARIRLIVELYSLDIGENGMPVVLSLLDQLFDARRALSHIRATLDTAPEPLRNALRATTGGDPTHPDQQT